MDREKLKNLAIRTVSSIVLLLVVVGALVLSKWSVGVLFAAVMIGGLAEFYKLCQKRGYKPMSWVGFSTSIALFAGSFSVFVSYDAFLSDMADTADTAILIAVMCLLYIVVMIPTTLVLELWHKSSTPIENLATTYMSVIYIAFPMAVIFYVPEALVGDWNAWAMLAFMAIVWANDVFAYLVGVSIGKHRMCERISPKKSWEGFFGGLVGAIGMALLFGYLFEGNLYIWGGLGVVTALAGVAGDLVESMMKREVDVKDSGKMMPGHGGFLDRFDALFVAVPFVMIYLFIASLVEHVVAAV